MRGQANGEDRRLQDDEEQQQRGEEQEQQQRGEEQEQQQRAEEQEQQQQRVEQRHHVRQRTASRPSSGQQPGAAMRNVGYVGKHRLSAAIARLDQELQSLQDELNELETLEPASAACHEVITSTVGKPDPLLPTTSGPENSSWDRWFQRVRSSRSNKWWASKGSDFP